MRFPRILFFMLLLTASMLSTAANAAATGEILPMVEFQIPTNDGAMANAMYFLTSDQRELLFIWNGQGKLLVYYLSKDPTPQPPTPTPNPTPAPTKLTIAVVENVCCTPLAQRGVLADKSWRDKATANHNFIGVIPSTIIDYSTRKPPPGFQKYLSQANGKQMPWLMFYNDEDKLIFEGQVPQTSAEMLDLMKKYGGK